MKAPATLTAAALAVALAGILPAGANAAINGSISSCRDAQGTPVWQYQDARLRNVAIATRLRDGRPIMVFNPRVMARFSPITQRFWYFHECAHHALGHSLGHRPGSRERDADCWAIRQMKARGMLRGQSLAIIQADMRRLGGDGHLYLPGPERAVHLTACLNYTAHRYNDPNYRAQARYTRSRNTRSTPGYAGTRRGEGRGERRTGTRNPYNMTTPDGRLPLDVREGEVGQPYRLPQARVPSRRNVLPPGGAGERRGDNRSAAHSAPAENMPPASAFR